MRRRRHPDETATQQTQSAPLGLAGDTSKKPKKPKPTEKTRYSDTQKPKSDETQTTNTPDIDYARSGDRSNACGTSYSTRHSTGAYAVARGDSLERKMKDVYIADFAAHEDKVITSFFVATQKQVSTTTGGAAYLELTLTDRTGQVEARMWDNVPESAPSIRTGRSGEGACLRLPV